MEAGGIPVKRILLTSGLADSNRFVVQMVANVLGRTIDLPTLTNAAVGAAIHVNVAAGVVDNFGEGAKRFGATAWQRFEPDLEKTRVYEGLFSHYQQLINDKTIRDVMHRLYAMQVTAQRR